MKKKVQLLLALVIFLLMYGALMMSGAQKLQLELRGNGNLSILLTENFKKQRMYPWLNEEGDRYYFFLPAYCEADDICLNLEEDKDILINGMPMRSGSKFEWQEDITYQLEIRAENTTASYDLVFLRSENLPAVYIATDSGSMDFLRQDKENEEQGNINIVMANGTVEYSGRLSKISGRGNSTWRQVKRPYAITLHEEKPLLGMNSGTDWYLLTGVFEGSKMNNKVAFDIAELLGLDYSPQCTWIDLYLNGEYAGMYILTESVSVEQGRVDINDLEKQNKVNNPNIEEADTFEENGMKGYIINNDGNISGGYLFEKDTSRYFNEKESGFKTLENNIFTLKSPKHASREQVEYLSGYVQNIEDMLGEGNIEYRNYIDFESFTRKFIVDEIVLTMDVNVTSMFYYKKMDDDLLYAGPVWDYDGGFGEVHGIWTDPEFSLLDLSESWYTKLYNDEMFRTRVIEIYSDALPRMEELEAKIDVYADYIRKSVALDKIRWENTVIEGEYPGHYAEFDNNVRYLKFYLANRLNYLSKRWDVNYRELPLPTVEGTHEITFWRNGELIETRVVADGEVLEQLPDLDEDVFEGWFFTHNGEIYGIHVPIYEDTDFYAKRKEKY